MILCLHHIPNFNWPRITNEGAIPIPVWSIMLSLSDYKMVKSLFVLLSANISKFPIYKTIVTNQSPISRICLYLHMFHVKLRLEKKDGEVLSSLFIVN